MILVSGCLYRTKHQLIAIDGTNNSFNTYYELNPNEFLLFLKVVDSIWLRGKQEYLFLFKGTKIFLSSEQIKKIEPIEN